MIYIYNKNLWYYKNIDFLEKRRIYNNEKIHITSESLKSLEGREKEKIVFTEEIQYEKVKQIRELIKNREDGYILIEKVNEVITRHNLSKDDGLKIIKEIFPNYDETKNTIVDVNDYLGVEIDKDGFVKNAGETIENPIEPIIGTENIKFFELNKKLIENKLGKGTLFVGVENNTVKLGFKVGKTLDEGIHVMEFKIQNDQLVPITEITHEELNELKKYNSEDDFKKFEFTKKGKEALVFVKTMKDQDGKIIQDKKVVDFLNRNDNIELYYNEDGYKTDEKGKILGGKYIFNKNGDIIGFDKNAKLIKKKVLFNLSHIKKGLDGCSDGTCNVAIDKYLSSESYTENYKGLLTKINNKYTSMEKVPKNKPNPLIVVVSKGCKYCKKTLRYINSNLSKEVDNSGIVIISADQLPQEYKELGGGLTPRLYKKVVGRNIMLSDGMPYTEEEIKTEKDGDFDHNPNWVNIKGILKK